MRADVAKFLYEEITSTDDFDNSLQIRPDIPEREELLDQVADALTNCTTHDRGRPIPCP